MVYRVTQHLPKNPIIYMKMKRINSLLAFPSAMLLCFDVYAAGPSRYECLIEPNQTIELHSSVAGRLDKVYVSRGGKVAKDQVVATLESTAERAAAELARYKSEMTGPTITAERKLEFATRKFKRYQDMQSADFMSVQEKDDAESEMRLAESELKLAGENRALAKLEWQQQNALLELRTLRSPFDGVVTKQMLYAGEVVNPGDQGGGVLELAQLNPLRVHVVLPLATFKNVKKGMAMQVAPEGPLGGRYTARVKMVDRVVDAASGTFSVYLELPNPKMDIPAGVKCQTEIAAR